MIVIGFLIYGPVMLIGLHAWNWHRKKRQVRQRVLPGCLVPGRFGGGERDCWLHRGLLRWDGGFMVMIGGSILAVILLML